MSTEIAHSFRASGRVQGVGYRVFTRHSAQALQITGWVRNCRDGTVEGEAVGSPGNLRRFLEILESGPPHGRVDSLVVEPIDPSHYVTFEIRR